MRINRDFAELLVNLSLMCSILFSLVYREFDEELKAEKVLNEPDLTTTLVFLFVN